MVGSTESGETCQPKLTNAAGLGRHGDLDAALPLDPAGFLRGSESTARPSRV